MTPRENVSLAELTTFHLGGVARFLFECSTEEEVRDALKFAKERAVPVCVLGGGSNVLISDTGFNGVVIRPTLPGITQEADGAYERVTAGAGVSWDELVRTSVDTGLSGFECLSGIPGTVGGAVVQNIGAYGAAVEDTFLYADVIDCTLPGFAKRRFQKEECNFSYHDSVFGKESGRYIVLSAAFALSRGRTQLPTYRDNRFDAAAFVKKNHREPTLADVRASILEIRTEKGLLARAGEKPFLSAGSFFHMPLVTGEAYARIRDTAVRLDADKELTLRPWAWEQEDGTYKLAPGFLLEFTKFKKGYRQGAVGISPKHILTILNEDGGTAREIATLAHEMRQAVQHQFGVRLTREVEYIGDIEPA